MDGIGMREMGDRKWEVWECVGMCGNVPCRYVHR